VTHAPQIILLAQNNAIETHGWGSRMPRWAGRSTSSVDATGARGSRLAAVSSHASARRR
jgi:hypothetical protein